MDANKVIYPKSNVKQMEVIYSNNEFSIAALQWNNRNSIAIRWNGNKESIGYPQSHGYPTWFIIPKEVALAFAQNIKNSKMESIIRASSDEPFT